MTLKDLLFEVIRLSNEKSINLDVGNLEVFMNHEEEVGYSRCSRLEIDDHPYIDDKKVIWIRYY